MISARRQRRRHERARCAYATEEGRRRARMCRAKSVYADEMEAIGACIVVSAEHGPRRYYACPYCGGYHLTSRVEDLGCLCGA